MKQLSFNWNAPDKHVDLLDFKMEVTNILQTKMYEMTEEEKVLIIKDWLVREGLQLIHTFKNSEKETCKKQRDIFHVRWEIHATP